MQTLDLGGWDLDGKECRNGEMCIWLLPLKKSGLRAEGRTLVKRRGLVAIDFAI